MGAKMNDRPEEYAHNAGEFGAFCGIGRFGKSAGTGPVESGHLAEQKEALPKMAFFAKPVDNPVDNCQKGGQK
jgi:hypothetical protein